MKRQSLFSEKNKKSISNCCLLKLLPSMLSTEALHKIVAENIFFFFQRKLDLALHMNHLILPSRLFTWNVKPYFL